MNGIRGFHRRGKTVAMDAHPLRSVETIPARVRSLVVADSPFMLKILAQTLRDAGDFDLVGTATHAYQALQHMSTLSPELVLMDIPCAAAQSLKDSFRRCRLRIFRLA